MKFSQFAGTAIVPTLSRLVLALAFVTAGYNKLMDDTKFNASEATILEQLGVDVVKATPTSAEQTADAARHRVVLASFQETPAPAEEDEASEETGDPTEEATGTPTDKAGADKDPGPGEGDSEGSGDAGGGGEAGGSDQPVVSPPAAMPTLDDSATYTAKGMHRVTLMCHENAWPVPKYMALAAGITELLGGGMLLIGFLSRIWALGLAITMGVAFFFVSMGYNQIFATNPFEFALQHGQFNAAFSQLGLFVLSFGVLMTGPGPLSLDRMLFQRRPPKQRGALDLDDVDDMPSPTSRPV